MPKTGLFRYGQPNHSLYEPSPEVIKGERDDENQSHYDRLGVLVTQIRNRTQRNRFHDARNQALRPCVWRADGASRESGFDPNMHFGKMGLDTPSYNPVCLNSLLKLHCDIVASICDELGRSSDAGKWKNESARITDAMQAKLCGENGIYTSYHMYDKRLSTRPFLTSAYPLFAGIATQDEAKATRDFIFRHFWTPRGLRAAPRDDDTQWSKIWAPLNDIAARGLRRYGFNGDADTIEAAFLGTVIEAFDRHGALFEKYDPSAEDSAHIANVVGGYHTNEKGFGWTNAVAADIVDRQPGMAPAPERRRVSAVPYGDGAGGVPLAAFAAPGL